MNARLTAKAVALGVLCGIAWAAGFRAWMSEISGPASRVDWTGTFGAIILPGAIVGGLLGWADIIRRSGGRRGWRWLALSPLAFVVAPFLRPGAVQSFLAEGLGGGAIAVAGVAVLGGFSVSGRGWMWARIVCGAVATIFLVGMTAATFFIGGRALAATEPRGVWVALIAASFLIVLVFAESIPFRPVVKPQSDTSASADAGTGRIPLAR